MSALNYSVKKEYTPFSAFIELKNSLCNYATRTDLHNMEYKIWEVKAMAEKM
jgi:hypothetical protein